VQTTARLLLIVVLLASSALAQQTAEIFRVLYFNSTASPERFQEIAAVIARVTGMPQSSVEAKETSLMLRGTVAQVALAEWLFTNLDKSRSEQAQQSQHGAKYEYRVPDGADDFVRVFYLSNPEKIGDFQEVATAVQATADISLSTYNDLGAVVMRGTSAQADLAEFLLAQMDRPGIELNPLQTLQSSASPEFRTHESTEDLVRVFYEPNTTVLEFQEEYTLVRVMARFRRCFACNAPRAIAARETDGQLALSEWLFTELDKASIAEARVNSGPHEFRISPTSDEFVRVFYLARADTRQRFNEIAIQVQRKAKDPEVFPFAPRGAIVVRGTARQIELADRAIQDQDR
jgi:hypothetical protein